MVSTQLPLAAGPGTNQREYFGEYVRAHRFGRTEMVDQIENELVNRRKERRGSHVVVVHAPYPEEINAAQGARNAGQGYGKSDLLQLAAARLDKPDCHVSAFLNNHDRLGDGKDFFKGRFIDELAKQNRKLMRPRRWSLAALRVRASLLRDRLSLLVYKAMPAFFSVVAYVIGWVGLKFIELLDPKNESALTNVTKWFARYQGPLLGVALILLCTWLLYAWGAIKADDKALAQWDGADQRRTESGRIEELRTKFADNPEQILTHFAGGGQTWVVIIDDVDLLDGESFQPLRNLHESAKQSDEWSLLLILGYNPQNPTLDQPPKRVIRKTLDATDARGQNWTLIPLSAPSTEELRTWLWGFYGCSEAADLVEVLEQSFEEAKGNAGLVLSFLIDEDRKLSTKEQVAQVDVEAIKQRFKDYLRRDRRIAEDIIASIKIQPSADECIRLLRYILAFKRDDVRISHLTTVMGKSYEQIAGVADVLIEQERLLQQTTKDGDPAYEFRNPAFRSLLDTGWKDWRADAARYYTEVFRKLSKIPSAFEDPRLALEAEPSQLAIDVLYREGEYYYKYFGASGKYSGAADAGFALTFYGRERGGALGKWIDLCERVLKDQDYAKLWDYIEWKSEARINPYRRWTQQIYPARSFAPDLVLTAGRLYWMNGQWKEAERLWTKDWPKVYNQLPPLDPAAQVGNLQKRVDKAHVDIQAALAEMYYHVAQPGHWDTAYELCSEISRDSPVAGLILELIRHYRETGLGNSLAPYRFLRQDVTLDGLHSAAAAYAEVDVERLRPLHLIAEAVWQMLPLAGELPREINLTQVEPPHMDDEVNAIFARFERALAAEQQALERILGFRKGQKRKVLPGERAREGDLLLWEGLLLFLRARQFSVKAWQICASPNQLFRRQLAAEAHQRFQTSCAIAHQIDDFYRAALFDTQTSAPFASLMAELKQLEGTLALSEQDVPIRGRKARTVAEQSYALGWHGLVDEALSRLHGAEAIYRRLGNQQGFAAVAFARGVVLNQFSEEKESRESPEWLDEFERFWHRSNGELGYHVEAPRAHIMTARWAEKHDLPRAVHAYQSADTWLSPEHLSLPKAFSGEVNFQIGQLIGNALETPFGEADVLEAFKKAEQMLAGLSSAPPYIGSGELLGRRLVIHWWFAEMHVRGAADELDPVRRETILDQAIDECAWIKRRARGHAAHATVENQARLVLGRVLSVRGQMQQAIEELETALRYFTDQEQQINRLQVLTALVTLAFMPRVKDQRWEEFVKRCIEHHLPALEKVATEARADRSRLDPVGSLALYQAGTLLGRLFAHSDPDKALDWFKAMFDLLVERGLFGRAILLDEYIRPLYEKKKDTVGLEQHKQAILNAAQWLDAERERIHAEVGAIVLRYSQRRVVPSRASARKEENLERALKALHGSEPQPEEAIALLEGAGMLMELDAPEPIDLDILRQLRIAYYRMGDTAKATAATSGLESAESTMQGRDFLALARYYERTGGDAEWALRIAAAARPSNKYALEAQKELNRRQKKPVEVPELVSRN